MPSRSKIHRIRRPCFNIDGCATLWTVALKRPIFKWKKGFANISLGLNYCSMCSSWPWSRDTVPLNNLQRIRGGWTLFWRQFSPCWHASSSSWTNRSQLSSSTERSISKLQHFFNLNKRNYYENHSTLFKTVFAATHLDPSHISYSVFPIYTVY
jgi:hypothetical protein